MGSRLVMRPDSFVDFSAI